jgi:hypothetical protein
MSRAIIAFTGDINSGKSTAAEILYTYGFIEQSFAQPLKLMALNVGFTFEQVFGTQEEKLEVNEFWGITGREFLQKFGSEVCREALPKAIPNMKMNGKTLWARIMETKFNRYPLVAVSDCRFVDEADLIKSYGGIVIRINRKTTIVDETNIVNETNIVDETTIVDDVSGHISEQSNKQIKEDYIINNDGTIEDLESAIDNIIESSKLNLTKNKGDLILKFKSNTSATTDNKYMLTDLFISVSFTIAAIALLTGLLTNNI